MKETVRAVKEFESATKIETPPEMLSQLLQRYSASTAEEANNRALRAAMSCAALNSSSRTTKITAISCVSDVDSDWQNYKIINTCIFIPHTKVDVNPLVTSTTYVSCSSACQRARQCRILWPIIEIGRNSNSCCPSLEPQTLAIPIQSRQHAISKIDQEWDMVSIELVVSPAWSFYADDSQISIE